MIAATLSLLAGLVGLVAWLLKRRASSNDKPSTKRLQRRQEVSREIVSDDSAAANRRIDNWLIRLRGSNRDKRGQGAAPTEVKSNLPS
jgi:1,6-anhydro-N-acetylmuramate kinase